MAESRPGVMLYFETLQAIEELEAEDAKQILNAILHYCRDGEKPAFHGMPAALWHLIRNGLDRDGERYNEKQLRGHWLTYCRKCKSNGTDPLDFYEWAAQRADNDTLPFVERTVDSAVNVPQPSTTPSSSPSPTKRGSAPRPHFVPPTLDEVRAYCRERKSSVDPERFISYYQANGWKMGRNPMKDWRAAVQLWERRDFGQSGYAAETPNAPLKGFCTEDDVSAPMIKCKKTPRKKCSLVAERREKR